jgi:hypothetical protein
VQSTRIVAFMHAHIGWMLKKSVRFDSRFIRDIRKDSVALWVDKLYFVILLAGMVLPAAALNIAGTAAAAIAYRRSQRADPYAPRLAAARRALGAGAAGGGLIQTDQRGTRPLAAQSGRRPNSSNISNRVNFTFCTALLISCVSCQHSDKSRVKYL